MFHHRIRPSNMSEKLMNWLMWPVAMLSYILVLVGLIDGLLWLLSVLRSLLCVGCVK